MVSDSHKTENYYRLLSKVRDFDEDCVEWLEQNKIISSPEKINNHEEESNAALDGYLYVNNGEP